MICVDINTTKISLLRSSETEGHMIKMILHTIQNASKKRQSRGISVETNAPRYAGAPAERHLKNVAMI